MYMVWYARDALAQLPRASEEIEMGVPVEIENCASAATSGRGRARSCN